MEGFKFGKCGFGERLTLAAPQEEVLGDCHLDKVCCVSFDLYAFPKII